MRLVVRASTPREIAKNRTRMAHDGALIPRRDALWLAQGISPAEDEMTTEGKGVSDKKLRSRAWFDNPDNPDMTALYLERYLNFGLSREELQSGKPIIGIAQTGSDLSPCNRHHIVLAKRVRDGIRDAGGIAIEFPVHPIQETGKRPTAGLDRNLAYLSLVEVLYGYPLDGVVLTIGCDKTTPAMLMGAATVNIPAIALSRRADAQWLVPRRAHRLGHDRVEGPPALRHRRDQLQADDRPRRVVGALDRLLQHHGHGLDDELAGRSAGHGTAGRRRDSGALSRPPGDELPHRAFASSTWSRRT